MLIGQKIRSLRKSRGLTQSQLVQGIYERSYLSLIERGKIIPTAEAITHIASRLGVSLAEISSDDQATFESSMALLRTGIHTMNESYFARAWSGFSKCKSLDEMIFSVKNELQYLITGRLSVL